MEKNLDKDCNAFVSHTLAGKIDSVKVYGEPRPSNKKLIIAGWHTRIESGDIVHYHAGNFFQDYRVTRCVRIGKEDNWRIVADVEPLPNGLSELMKEAI